MTEHRPAQAKAKGAGLYDRALLLYGAKRNDVQTLHEVCATCRGRAGSDEIKVWITELANRCVGWRSC